MKYQTDDLRIKEIKELLPPASLLADFPITEKAAQSVYEARREIHRILHGADESYRAEFQKKRRPGGHRTGWSVGVDTYRPLTPSPEFAKIAR